MPSFENVVVQSEMDKICEHKWKTQNCKKGKYWLVVFPGVQTLSWTFQRVLATEKVMETKSSHGLSCPYGQSGKNVSTMQAGQARCLVWYIK